MVGLNSRRCRPKNSSLAFRACLLNCSLVYGTTVSAGSLQPPLSFVPIARTRTQIRDALVNPSNVAFDFVELSLNAQLLGVFGSVAVWIS